jgi:hypothetical protein
MAKMTKSSNWKKVGQHSPLRNVFKKKEMFFSTPQPMSQTKQRGFREKTSGAGAGSIYKIWNHTPS